MNKGVFYALGAYMTWGLFPIYWKLLQHVPALQLLSHRILWSFIFLALAIWITGQFKTFRSAVSQPRVLRIYFVAALLIGINWLVYVWSVNAGFIVEASLGYFINPLLSVLLGVFVLGERLRQFQWAAIGLAFGGVLYLTISYGSLPWISLVLAFSFAAYGLIKKMAPLNSVNGLTLETGILFLPVLAFLIYSESAGKGAFLHSGAGSDLLMIGAGLVTTIPLLMFSSAARLIPLSLVGIFQYIAPTLQFLLGVFIYKEAFTSTKLVGFSMVWVALALYGLEGWLFKKHLKNLSPIESRSVL